MFASSSNKIKDLSADTEAPISSSLSPKAQDRNVPRSRIPRHQKSKNVVHVPGEKQESSALSIPITNIQPPFAPGRDKTSRTRNTSPFALTANEDNSVQDTSIPAVIATRTYSGQSSRSSTPLPSRSSTPLSSNNSIGQWSTPDNPQFFSETVVRDAFSEPVVVLENLGLLDVFDLTEVHPLTFNSRRLRMNTDVNDWSVAVIQQRWYQSIGSKLQIGAVEFLNEIKAGLEYLEAWGRFEPDINMLHFWAHGIVAEVEWHATDPEAASIWVNEDGTWAFPRVIVPELIELLPLSLDDRQSYYSEAWVLSTELVKDGVPTDFSLDVIVHKPILVGTYISRVTDAFSRLCLDVGNSMKSYFHEAYPPSRLHPIEQDWIDDLESDRIIEDQEEAERSRTPNLLVNRKRRSVPVGFAPGSSSENDLSIEERAPSHFSMPTRAVDPLPRAWSIFIDPPAPVAGPKPVSNPQSFDWADDEDLPDPSQLVWAVPNVAALPASNNVSQPSGFNWADEDEDLPDPSQLVWAVPEVTALVGGINSESSSQGDSESQASVQTSFEPENVPDDLMAGANESEILPEDHFPMVPSPTEVSYETSQPIIPGGNDAELFHGQDFEVAALTNSQEHEEDFEELTSSDYDDKPPSIIVKPHLRRSLGPEDFLMAFNGGEVAAETNAQEDEEAFEELTLSDHDVSDDKPPSVIVKPHLRRSMGPEDLQMTFSAPQSNIVEDDLDEMDTMGSDTAAVPVKATEQAFDSEAINGPVSLDPRVHSETNIHILAVSKTPVVANTEEETTGSVLGDVLRKWEKSGNPFSKDTQHLSESVPDASKEQARARMQELSGYILDYEGGLVSLMIDGGVNMLVELKDGALSRVANMLFGPFLTMAYC